MVEEVFSTETFWDSTSSVAVDEDLFPFSVTLGQNYPNPVNLSTKIDFSIKERIHIELSVYNLMGIKVIELFNQNMDPGSYTTHLSVDHLTDGIYIYVLKADKFIETRRFIVQR